MKRLSKILAAVVAVALVLALAVPALAAGSITVLNPGEHTYTAYKIFDVTDDGSGNLSYTVEDPWMSEIIAAVEDGTISGLQIYDIDEVTGIGKVAKLDSFKAAEFAEWAKTLAKLQTKLCFVHCKKHDILMRIWGILVLHLNIIVILHLR